LDETDEPPTVSARREGAEAVMVAVWSMMPAPVVVVVVVAVRMPVAVENGEVTSDGGMK
jgi:hypothetical protein